MELSKYFSIVKRNEGLMNVSPMDAVKILTEHFTDLGICNGSESPYGMAYKVIIYTKHWWWLYDETGLDYFLVKDIFTNPIKYRKIWEDSTKYSTEFITNDVVLTILLWHFCGKDWYTDACVRAYQANNIICEEIIKRTQPNFLKYILDKIFNDKKQISCFY